jgi:hypothetical protein
LYFHLGGDAMILKSSIVAIFDLDATTVSNDTRSLLADAEKHGKILSVNAELPKSFIITGEGDDKIIYLSPLSSVTLHKRLRDKGRQLK